MIKEYEEDFRKVFENYESKILKPLLVLDGKRF
jgi:hypothetical protein